MVFPCAFSCSRGVVPEDLFLKRRGPVAGCSEPPENDRRLLFCARRQVAVARVQSSTPRARASTMASRVSLASHIAWRVSRGQRVRTSSDPRSHFTPARSASSTDCTPGLFLVVFLNLRLRANGRVVGARPGDPGILARFLLEVPLIDAFY